MPSFDERLKAYNQQGMFGKWQLDGATLEDALLGTGSYGRVYKICRVVRDSHGGKTTHENALKVVSIDAETCDKEHKYAPGSPELEKTAARPPEQGGARDRHTAQTGGRGQHRLL